MHPGHLLPLSVSLETSGNISNSCFFFLFAIVADLTTAQNNTQQNQTIISSVKENSKVPVSVKSNKENCQKLKQSSKSVLKSVLPVEIFSQQELLTTNQDHLDDENISVLAKYEAIWDNQSNN